MEATVEVRSNGGRRATGSRGDLIEGELVQIAQAHGLAVVRRQVRDRGQEPRRSFAALDGGRWIVRGRCDPAHLDAVLIDGEGRIGPTPEGSVAGFTDRDPHQPAAERAIAAERGKFAIGREKGILGRILGVGRIRKDASADREDDGRLPVDERAKGVPVAAKDGIDQGTVLVASPLVRLGTSCCPVSIPAADMASRPVCKGGGPDQP
jgi:hypothetical protein